MTDSMVEVVARAICKDRFLGDADDDGWDSATPEIQRDYLGHARAAIEAMREPTEAMIQVGWNYCDYHGKPDEFWRAMISAALSPKDENLEIDTPCK